MPISASESERRARADFLILAEWEHRLDDHGPQNPFLWQLADLLDLTLEERLWLVMLGMAYYQEGSAWVAWNTPGVRARKQPPPVDLPIGVLRRNLFGGKIAKHFADMSRINSFVQWLKPAKDWNSLIETIRGLWGNGSWSSYTTAEAVISITGWDVTPTTEWFLSNSGPRKGLASLGFSVDEAGVGSLRSMIGDKGLAIPIAALETVMCNWNNMRKGEFYIGRSLDRQQSRILEISYRCDCSLLWEARKKAFNNQALGELNGWPGLDRKRLKLYKQTGRMPLPWENR
jgi:hypothetical protein